MPCITLLLETQHSELIEAAEALARSAPADGGTWPGEVHGLRDALERHDRIEREVFEVLGFDGSGEPLAPVLDRLLAARRSLGPAAVAAAARELALAVEAHAEVQEHDVFPRIVESFPRHFRNEIAERYLDASRTNGIMISAETETGGRRRGPSASGQAAPEQEWSV